MDGDGDDRHGGAPLQILFPSPIFSTLKNPLALIEEEMAPWPDSSPVAPSPLGSAPPSSDLAPVSFAPRGGGAFLCPRGG